MLEYALNEFVIQEVPKNSSLAAVLKNWQGAPNTFKKFSKFVDELVEQYEMTDESLLAGKSMDCLEVYNHLFRGIMKVKTGKRKRANIVKRMKGWLEPMMDRYTFLNCVPIDGAGIEVLEIDVNVVAYQHLRDSLEEVLRLLAKAVREIVTPKAYRDMLFDYVMPYVKSDIQRLQTYAILDDVVRYLF
jgi:hypothetical protein